MAKRALNFFRGRKGTKPAAGSPGEGAGLDAFASETAPPSAGPALPAGPAGRSRVVPGLLVGIILLQAVPSFLWLHERLPIRAAIAAADAPLPAPPPSPVVVAGPCEAPAAALAEAAPPAPVGTAAPAPAVPAGALAGLLSIAAPAPMHVYARGKLVGTTEADSIMLPVGTHDLEFANDEIGYRTRRSVTVAAGRTTALRLEAPAGTMHVNAVPWAEVWIDDQRVGETPIGNYKAPVGRREVIFRHPQLGERRATVLVTLKAPARVSMDLRGR